MGQSTVLGIPSLRCDDSAGFAKQIVSEFEHFLILCKHIVYDTYENMKAFSDDLVLSISIVMIYFPISFFSDLIIILL